MKVLFHGAEAQNPRPMGCHGGDFDALAGREPPFDSTPTPGWGGDSQAVGHALVTGFCGFGSQVFIPGSHDRLGEDTAQTAQLSASAYSQASYRRSLRPGRKPDRGPAGAVVETIGGCGDPLQRLRGLKVVAIGEQTVVTCAGIEEVSSQAGVATFDDPQAPFRGPEQNEFVRSGAIGHGRPVEAVGLRLPHGGSP
jgi:hypothetical protein